MIAVLISLIIILAILIFAEFLWHKGSLKGEFGRKFIHITVGCFVAFWPFYMSFRTIQLITLAFLIVVLASRYLNVFKAIRSIDRKTWGDVLFAVGVGVSALTANSDWVFMAAILTLSLGDGLAAVVGKRFGGKSEYTIFGYTKSIVGTLTFWAITYLIVLVTLSFGGNQPVKPLLMVWLPLATTAIENLAIHGFDNIFIPLIIVLALNPLKFLS